MAEINWPTREEWAAELRSPNVGEQAQGFLKLNDGSRCCLGVLCDMAEIPHDFHSNNARYKFSVSLTKASNIPVNLLPGWMSPSTQSVYVWMNDSGYTFSEIADMSEQIPAYMSPASANSLMLKLAKERDEK